MIGNTDTQSRVPLQYSVTESKRYCARVGRVCALVESRTKVDRVIDERATVGNRFGGLLRAAMCGNSPLLMAVVS